MGAAIVDAVVTIPIAVGILHLQGSGFAVAIVLSVVGSALFAMYNVCFNAVYGGTLGKLAVGIRVTRPNGSRIGWREAWYRASIDLAFAALFLVIELQTLFRLDWENFQGEDFRDRLDLLVAHYPAWYGPVDLAESIWVWGELVVLLLNERKRAIHDFIAGTVVVRKEFSGQASSVDRGVFME